MAPAYVRVGRAALNGSLAVLWVGIIAVGWLPFFIGDPMRVSALRFAMARRAPAARSRHQELP